MSNDLVVQLGAKLDQFASDMNQAGDMADSAVGRIEQSFASLNPTAGGLGSLATVFTGAVGSVGALLAALASVNSQLADIAKNAEFVGVSVERFQQIQFGAGQKGDVSSGQSATDLSNVAKLLADANYNENSLTKVLDANNLKYKDRNGQIISLNQLLTVAGTLLGKFDSIPDKTKAAQMLGLSQGWVGALHDGSDAFNKVADSANAAGTVIDAQTVAKAAAFDAAWKQSSDLLSRQFKAAAGDVAAVLDGLIDKANDFFASLAQAQGKNVGDSGQNKFNVYADALDVASKEAAGLSQDVDQLTRVIEHMAQTGGDPDIIRGLQAAREEAQRTTEFIREVYEMEAKKQFPGGVVPLPTARPSAANTPTGDGKLPQRGGSGADPIQDAINSLNKHTLATQADADAVGKGAEALARFRAEAVESAAVQKNGGKETDAQADAFQDLQDKAAAAAGALAKAKVANDISRGQQTSLLSPEDVQIANQLKDLYPDVATALSSVEASALRTNDALKGASSSISNDLTSGLTDITTGAKTASQGFSDMAASILKDIEQMVIKLLIVGPLMRSLQSGFSGTGLLSLVGIGHNAGGTDNWQGGPTWVGENGPEIVNLPRGAQVVPNAVASRSSSGGGTSITYQINAAGADSGTVARIQSVLAAHARAIQGQGKTMESAQRYQSTGVG